MAGRAWKRFFTVAREGVALGAVSALLIRSAFADEATPLPLLKWDAPDGCPSESVVVARIRAEQRPSRRADLLEDGIGVYVRVAEPASGLWRARMAIAADGAQTERWLEASSCDAIADAVALVVGLSAVSARPVAPPSPLASTTPSPPSPPSRIPVSPAPARRGPEGLSARLGAIADAGSLPSAAPGAGLGLSWRGPHVALNLEAAWFASERASLPAIPQEGASIGMTYGVLDACLSVPPADRFVLDACAGVGFALFVSEGVGPKGTFVPAHPNPAFVPSGMGELGLEWWPLEHIGLRVAARGLAPLARRAFHIDGPGGGDVFTPAFAIEPYVGLVVPLAK